MNTPDLTRIPRVLIHGRPYTVREWKYSEASGYATTTMTLTPEDPLQPGQARYSEWSNPHVRVWDGDWRLQWDSDTSDQTLEDWLTDQPPIAYNVTKDQPGKPRWSGTVIRNVYGLDWAEYNEMHEALYRILEWPNPWLPDMSERVDEVLKPLYWDTALAYHEWRLRGSAGQADRNGG